MTRKDYEAIAAATRDLIIEIADQDIGSEAIANRIYGIERLASRLAATFERDNPRFDRQRFLDASLHLLNPT